METRHCPRCGNDKPPGEFARDKTKASGYKSYCRDCDNAKSRAYYHANREAKLARYQANREQIQLARYGVPRAMAVEVYGGCCEQCGGTKGLEFHHPDGDGGDHRKAEPHQAMYRRIAREGKPLADWRLRLLCFDCHHDEHPPPAPVPMLVLARRWQHELTTLPRSHAAAAIGISPRTVQRWRQELRMAGMVIADRNHPWTRRASAA